MGRSFSSSEKKKNNSNKNKLSKKRRRSGSIGTNNLNEGGQPQQATTVKKRNDAKQRKKSASSSKQNVAIPAKSSQSHKKAQLSSVSQTYGPLSVAVHWDAFSTLKKNANSQESRTKPNVSQKNGSKTKQQQQQPQISSSGKSSLTSASARAAEERRQSALAKNKNSKKKKSKEAPHHKKTLAKRKLTTGRPAPTQAPSGVRYVGTVLPGGTTGGRNKKNTFSLNLPYHGEELSCRAVPWMQGSSSTSTTRTAADVPSTPQQGRYDFLRNLSTETMNQLDAELECFAQYVSLSSHECLLRNEFVRQVNQTTSQAFGYTQHPDAHVKVFGSFATQSLCSYHSDVDMAVWGIVPLPPTAISSSNNKTTPEPLAAASSSSTSAEASKTISAEEREQQRRKQERLKRWRDAFEALDAKVAAQESQQENPDDQTKNEEENNVSSEAYFKTMTKKQDASVDQEEPEFLFVIDRKGDPKTDSDDISNAPLALNDQNRNSGVSVTESRDDDNGNYGAEGVASEKEPQPTAAVACLNETDSKNDNVEMGNWVQLPLADGTSMTADQSHAVLSRDQQNQQADDHSDSDVDTADKLEAWASNATEANVQSKQEERHVVSLSSSSSATDEEDEEDDDETGEYADESEDSQMNVSFISNPQPTFIASPSAKGPTGRIKRECIDVLRRIQNGMRRGTLSTSSQLISGARVPIVKFQTSTGFEADIAVGGHNGADTSQYAASQVEKYQR